MRVYNFSAGPAVLPEPVLAQAQDELLDWGGSGMSVMEVSHRGKAFVACAARAEAALRELMGIPDDYRVLFLQGGAFGQFAAVPMNLAAEGATAAFLNTGDWSAKAIGEARKYVTVDVVADEKADNYVRVPAAGSYRVDPAAAYLHYTPNETIRGVEFGYVPETGDVPLVADLSSTLLSRPVDVSRFGLIDAGAQKNMGPSGMCVVIVRDDLLGRARATTPSVWNYATMAANGLMLNTPPTFGWYLLGLVYQWVLDQAPRLPR
ncbi:MAG: 3-phosphoserine/phosphohydroxythreonine transaminase [Micropruina sp.]